MSSTVNLGLKVARKNEVGGENNVQILEELAAKKNGNWSIQQANLFSLYFLDLEKPLH